MRLRHIEIFHAIYTTGSITNAAKMLHVSQPSVSKVLSHAEMQLGFNLFERVKGRLIPTEEANTLFGEVDKIYQQLHGIRKTTENLKRSEYGNICLGLTPALGFKVIPEAVARYNHAYPHVYIDMQTVHNDEVMQALLERKYDMAVLFAPNELPGVNAITLGESELVVVYPKELFPEQPTTLPLSVLAQHQVIDIADSGPLGDKLANQLLKHDIKLQSTMKVHTYFIAARLVEQGLGICVVDKLTAQGNLADNMAFASFENKLTFKIKLLHLETNQLSSVAANFIPYIHT